LQCLAASLMRSCLIICGVRFSCSFFASSFCHASSAAASWLTWSQSPLNVSSTAFASSDGPLSSTLENSTLFPASSSKHLQQIQGEKSFVSAALWPGCATLISAAATRISQLPPRQLSFVSSGVPAVLLLGPPGCGKCDLLSYFAIGLSLICHYSCLSGVYSSACTIRSIVGSCKRSCCIVAASQLLKPTKSHFYRLPYYVNAFCMLAFQHRMLQQLREKRALPSRQRCPRREGVTAFV
jgi:hypothetical protein